MHHKIISVLLFLGCWVGVFSQAETSAKRVVQGFDGGMMLHTGYLSCKVPNINYSTTGATFGMGGVVRMHLKEHWMLGTEGYVSIMRQMNNGSYIKNFWAGLLGEFYWSFKYVMPYVGVTVGGGKQTCFFMFDGNALDWKTEGKVLFHKQPFIAVDPFIGSDFLISKSFHLTLKMDYLCNIDTKGALLHLHGPRIYVGFIFYH